MEFCGTVVVLVAAGSGAAVGTSLAVCLALDWVCSVDIEFCHAGVQVPQQSLLDRGVESRRRYAWRQRQLWWLQESTYLHNTFHILTLRDTGTEFCWICHNNCQNCMILLLHILNFENRNHTQLQFNWSISFSDIIFLINFNNLCKFHNVSCTLGFEVPTFKIFLYKFQEMYNN